jgi:hypothetical protein
MHHGYNVNFYRNQLTSIVSSPNYPFFVLFSILSLIFLFLNLYNTSIFELSQLLFVCSVLVFKEAKELESSNSWTFGKLELHEMRSTLGVDSPMPHSPSSKVIHCMSFFILMEFLSTHVSMR